jgi:hypothetical protein
VRPEFGPAARTLVGGPPGDVVSSVLVAGRAARALDDLTAHLARLLGDAGVQLLLKRSIARASEQFPWLVGGASQGRATSALRDVMEKQDPESIADAVVAVLAAFVGLLERLIGQGLVARLLDEVWPSVFTPAAKDTP